MYYLLALECKQLVSCHGCYYGNSMLPVRVLFNYAGGW
jgi:hypothetical protein